MVILVLALCFILPTADEAMIEDYIDTQLTVIYGDGIKDVVSVDDFKIENNQFVAKDPVALQNKVNAYIASVNPAPVPETETAPEETETEVFLNGVSIGKFLGERGSLTEFALSVTRAPANFADIDDILFYHNF